jgi:hypothetical protein
MEKNSGNTEQTETISKDEIKGMVADAMKEFATFLIDRK